MFTLSNIAVTFFALFLAGQQAFANPTPDSSIHQLLVRQIDGLDYSQVPEQCQASCKPLADSISGCTSVDCICSEKNSEAIARCMSCAVGLEGSDVSVSSGQAAVDQYRDACKTAGVDLKPQTVTQGDQKNGASSQSPALIGAAAMAASALFLILN